MAGLTLGGALGGLLTQYQATIKAAVLKACEAELRKEIAQVIHGVADEAGLTDVQQDLITEVIEVALSRVILAAIPDPGAGAGLTPVAGLVVAQDAAGFGPGEASAAAPMVVPAEVDGWEPELDPYAADRRDPPTDPPPAADLTPDNSPESDDPPAEPLE